jgi:DNA-binding MarR family transcriptional regulator
MLSELAKHRDRRIGIISTQMAEMEKKGLVKVVRGVHDSKLLRFELIKKGLNTFYTFNKLILNT